MLTEKIQVYSVKNSFLLQTIQFASALAVFSFSQGFNVCHETVHKGIVFGCFLRHAPVNLVSLT